MRTPADALRDPRPGDVVRYTDFDPYLDCDRDVDIKARKVRVVRTRKPHVCLTANLKQHEIPAGSLARFESAVVDGEWGCYYTCLECIDYLMAQE